MKNIRIIVTLFIGMLGLCSCKPQEQDKMIIEVASFEGSQDIYTLENEHLRFELDPMTTYFRVQDKHTDQVWDSNPLAAADDPIADPLSKKYLQSTLLLEYVTEGGIVNSYSNYEFSILKQTYHIEQGQDAIRVIYTVGDTQKEYFYPVAAPESRMNEFTSKMESKQVKQIASYYKIYDINKLGATDNKEELLTAYPDLANEKVYVLREGVQDYLKEKIEKIFAEVGYDASDFEADKARYSGASSKEIPIFQVAVDYRIEDSALVVELPFEEMKWKDDYPLKTVRLLPYFGAGTKEEEGFLLVPEGGGALIHFNNNKTDHSNYYTEIYGWDEGMKRESVINENKAAMQLFGISKKDGAMLCILEDFETVASIQADISGRNHSYNYVNAAYTTLHSVAMEVSSKTDKSVMVYEAKKPKGTIRQRYLFIDRPEYSDMAKAYQGYLIEKNPSLVKLQESEAPVLVNIIGAVDHMRQKMGIPVSMPLKLTSYKEGKAMMEDLAEEGIDHIKLKYSGWINGGIKQSYDLDYQEVNVLGKESELEEWIDRSKELGVDVYLSAYSNYVFDDRALDGFRVNQDVSKYPSREVVELYQFSSVWYGQKTWLDAYYLLKPQKMIEQMEQFALKAKEYEVGAAYEDIGEVLSADYNPKNLYTREDVKEMQISSLAQLRAEGQEIMISHGNAYLLPYVSHIANMNYSGQNQNILDENVPFYQMAIHGLIPYTIYPINLSGDPQLALLNAVESGSGLAYTLMAEDSAILQETEYSELFAAEYRRWESVIKEQALRFQEEMGHCFNQYLVKHSSLSKDVKVSEYEDGTKVYVNYAMEAYQGDGFLVPANDYYVERGE